MTSFFQKFTRLAILTFLIGTAVARAGALLPLYAERGGTFDLAITGKLRDVPFGQTRYLRWDDLRKLPTQTLSLTGEFVPGEQKVTVVFLADFLKALPLSEGADTVLATCTDGYASVYKADFISKYRPFIILEINGEGPERWPPAGLTYNPGPYVISFSPQLVPAEPPFLDAEHKKPWGVAGIEIADFSERFKNVYRGKWALLSALLPVVLSLGMGHPAAIVFDDEQKVQIVMTLGQSLMGILFLINMQLAWWEAAAVFVLWAVQFVCSLLPTAAPAVQLWTTIAYFAWVTVELARMLLGKRKAEAFKAFRIIWNQHVRPAI